MNKTQTFHCYEDFRALKSSQDSLQAAKTDKTSRETEVQQQVSQE